MRVVGDSWESWAVSPHVVIAGPMGVGKSTTARGLGAWLDYPVRDSDQDIEALFGATGAEIAADRGVDALHAIEAAVLLGALAGPDPTVICAAGSTIEDESCRRALRRRSFVVVLRADTGELIRRSGQGLHRRSMDTAEMTAVAARRDPLYATVTQLTLDSRVPTTELVRAIVDALADPAITSDRR